MKNKNEKIDVRIIISGLDIAEVVSKSIDGLSIKWVF